MARRFVILEHHWDGVHYDLMFDSEGTLRTWKCAKPPSETPQPAEMIFDHRIDYLDYEGPVSGGRGEVLRWDSGTYEGSPRDDSVVRLSLSGQKCSGTLVLHPKDGGWEVRLRPRSIESIASTDD